MPTVEQYRRDLDELVRLANVDLDVLWRQVDDAVVARELLADILPELTAVYGSAAGTLAADWYDELRAENEIRGRFTAIVAATPPRAQTDSVAGWAVGPLFAVDPDFTQALANTKGSLQRLISNVGRETISTSAVADPRARGWQRIGSGECDWCNVLIGRGVVYSEATADFAAHDNCRCSAVPAWGGQPLPVKPYTPSPRQSRADYDRARQWMRENGY